MLRVATLSRALVAATLLLGERRRAGRRRRPADAAEQDHRRQRGQLADHTTLVAAVAAAGLVDTLKGVGPFTVFAPVNRAFQALPPGTVDQLMKPENRAALTSILTYHVVPGRLDSAALRARVARGGGMAELETVNGGGC
jgi:uncharacterized surface protein with fasciclin (FAS1) repeats